MNSRLTVRPLAREKINLHNPVLPSRARRTYACSCQPLSSLFGPFRLAGAREQHICQLSPSRARRIIVAALPSRATCLNINRPLHARATKVPVNNRRPCYAPSWPPARRRPDAPAGRRHRPVRRSGEWSADCPASGRLIPPPPAGPRLAPQSRQDRSGRIATCSGVHSSSTRRNRPAQRQASRRQGSSDGGSQPVGDQTVKCGRLDGQGRHAGLVSCVMLQFGRPAPKNGAGD